MDQILLPVDYSESSDRAMEMAAEIATSFHASIMLVHFYTIVVYPGEIPLLPIDSKDLYDAEFLKLYQYQEKLQLKYPGIVFNARVSSGDLKDSIINFCKDGEFNLLVMGISNNQMQHYIFNHNAMDLVNECIIPILMVPEQWKVKEIKSLVLSFDFQNLKDLSVLSFLVNFVDIMHAKLTVVHINKEKVDLKEESPVTLGDLEKALEGCEFNFHFTPARDNIDGILQSIQLFKPDIIAMIHHPRSFFARLFSVEHTKKMVFDSTIPILVVRGME